MSIVQNHWFRRAKLADSLEKNTGKALEKRAKALENFISSLEMCISKLEMYISTLEMCIFRLEMKFARYVTAFVGGFRHFFAGLHARNSEVTAIFARYYWKTAFVT